MYTCKTVATEMHGVVLRINALMLSTIALEANDFTAIIDKRSFIRCNFPIADSLNVEQVLATNARYDCEGWEHRFWDQLPDNLHEFVLSLPLFSKIEFQQLSLGFEWT